MCDLESLHEVNAIQNWLFVCLFVLVHEMSIFTGYCSLSITVTNGTNGKILEFKNS